MKTIQELEQMTDDELRVMLAELSGWKWQKFDGAMIAFMEHPSKPRTDYTGPRIDVSYKPLAVTSNLDEDGAPNYPADLNACYQVEIALKDDCPYIHALIEVCGNDNLNCYYASARQRTIALIATLQA